MNLQELIEEVRERVGDVSEPYFVSDARFARFANEAEQEACRRARLIFDTTTPACCVLALAAGTHTYALHAKVLFVRKASIDGYEPFLKRISRKDLDMMGSGWMAEEGEVMGFVPDLESRKLRFYMIPTAAATARLQVVRMPLTDLALGADAGASSTPEIASHLHIKLCDWMEHRYYSTNDSEVRDEKKAADALARFELEFGPPVPAIEEAWAQQHYGFQEDDGNVYGG